MIVQRKFFHLRRSFILPRTLSSPKENLACKEVRDFALNGVPHTRGFTMMLLQMQHFFISERNLAFISAGFTYWKEAVTAFKKNTSSACHQEAVEAIELLLRQAVDIGKMCDSSTWREKAANRAMFKRILQTFAF